jgi:hypothetical protein
VFVQQLRDAVSFFLVHGVLSSGLGVLDNIAPVNRFGKLKVNRNQSNPGNLIQSNLISSI